MVEQRTPREVLADALKERTELVDSAVAIFDLAQFLLDDDERLTKSGALDGVGRAQLQQRAIELLGGPPATDPLDDPILGDDGAHDFTGDDDADDDDDDDDAGEGEGEGDDD